MVVTCNKTPSLTIPVYKYYKILFFGQVLLGQKQNFNCEILLYTVVYIIIYGTYTHRYQNFQTFVCLQLYLIHQKKLSRVRQKCVK